MTTLTAEQQSRAIEVLKAYLAAPRNPNGRTPLEVQSEQDRKRVALIDGELKPLVENYLAGQLPLAEFKSQVDGLNKRNAYWGFKGPKGQMFFNLVLNTSADLGECDQEIKSAIALPGSEEIAKSRIKTFQSYVRRIGDDHVNGGGSKQGRPNPGSIPYFLSYFWQLQDRVRWPVYYTNSVSSMGDLNLWQPSGDLAEDYIAYKHVHEELISLYASEIGKPFDLYLVEHVFWFLNGNPYGGPKPWQPDNGNVTPPPPLPGFVVVPDPISRLPDSYVPPIIAILPRMAINEPGLEEAAKESGTTLPRAFEKGIDVAFTILGYETKLLGQGQGRVPDGIAIDQDNHYAILWDAKIRAGGYSMGTDDRTIREYVSTQSRELKKRSLRNIYYMIVSSGFRDSFDELIRSLKMETHTNEVCLVEAGALVAMVDAKLRYPLQISLGPDGIQRLFSDSGIITAEEVMQNLS